MAKIKIKEIAALNATINSTTWTECELKIEVKITKKGLEWRDQFGKQIITPDNATLIVLGNKIIGIRIFT